MASCVLQKISGEADHRSEHSVVWHYLFHADSVIYDPISAVEIAQSTGPDPVPGYGAQLNGRFLFAKRFPAEMTDKHRLYWTIQANFSPPEKGEDEDQQQQPNPLLRPPVHDIQYIEQEYVVEQAKNVQELTGGFTRAANTLGPIVNAAFRRPDEPIVDTERNAILVIERNYATLGDIINLNETYQRTCNSDAVTIGGQEISARRLKYLVTRSGGKQVENDIVFYPGITEIELRKTTDLTIDNVGYEYWDDDASKYVRAKDGDGEFAADPVNLTLGGELILTETTTITYRYLEEVAYASFFA